MRRFFIFLQILPSNKRNWPPEPITVLFGGALDSFTLRVFFRDLLILLSFCPRLTLYRTLDCLDFLCTFSHTNVKPVCSSWFDSVEVWCLHVQIFRGSFWFVCLFFSVLFRLLSSLPSSSLLFSLFSPSLIPLPPCVDLLIWLLPHTLKGNGTASKYNYHHFTHEAYLSRDGDALSTFGVAHFSSPNSCFLFLFDLFLSLRPFRKKKKKALLAFS